MFPVLRLLRRRIQNRRSIRNRIVNRQQFNSFDLSEERFIELYRLNKRKVRLIIERLRGQVHNSGLRRGVKIEQKVLTALRYYASGAYQRGVGEEYNLSVSQTSVHRYIQIVTIAIIEEFAHEYIRFPETREEKTRIKRGFMEKFGFPGVIGVVDGTHIAILKPQNDEQNFMNRKGFHSLNTQIICDSALKIINVNSNYGGSTHDSFIFEHSQVHNHLRHLRNETCWLLGDSGYSQLPYLMTPVRNPAPHSPEEHYNQCHIEARNCIERCIGVLKNRFRCLLKERVARYSPQFVGELIKACCILHNMCVDEHLPNEIIEGEQDQPLNRDPVQALPNPRPNILGVQFRQNIINQYFQ